MGHTLLPDPASMHHSVHPHIRGAYVILLNRSSPKPGSSPHTWGIQELGGADQDRLRFIPTYVGHTACSAATALAASVHPHIRGAYFRGTVCGTFRAGSSPHTWGIQAWPIPRSQLLRFIPTYVGHTISPVRCARRWTVHPHIRGAYALSGIAQVTDTRFIPTYVGHTPSARYQHCRLAVHPHIRGAYYVRVP